MTSSKKKEKKKTRPPVKSVSPLSVQNITKLKTCPSYARVQQHNKTFHLFLKHQNKKVKMSWQTERKCLNEYLLKPTAKLN